MLDILVEASAIEAASTLASQLECYGMSAAFLPCFACALTPSCLITDSDVPLQAVGRQNFGCDKGGWDIKGAGSWAGS